MDSEAEVPDKLVRDVLRADESSSKTWFGSKRYWIAEEKLVEAGQKLFESLNRVRDAAPK